MSNKDLRRQVVEYVSGIQTGVLSHTETTDGLISLITKSNNEARVDEHELIWSNAPDMESEWMAERLQQLKKGDTK